MDLRLTQAPTLLREQVVEKLRSAIVTGWYSPGTRLTERDLCESLGVSRTSVREALRQLEAERLVTIEPRRGPVVATISLRQAEEIYELRAILEVAAAKRFIKRATTENRTKLRQYYRDFAKAVKDDDRSALVESMSGFYDTLFFGANNSLLHSVSQQLMARISYLRATSMSEEGRPKVSMKEIGAIVSAIEAGDESATERAVIQHLVNAAEATFRQLGATTSQRGVLIAALK